MHNLDATTRDPLPRPRASAPGATRLALVVFLASSAALAATALAASARGPAAAPAPVPAAAPAPSAAPVAPARPASIRIAALILRAADARIDPTLSDSLTELLITSLAAAGGFELVGKEEVKALLRVDDEMRALECIVSPACLGALATHLRVAKALVGTVGKDAGGWLVNITLVNLATGETENNLFLKVSGDQTALFEKISAVAVAAATPRPPPGSVHVTCDVAGAEVLVDDASIGRAPARKAGLVAGTHRVRVAKPGYFDWTADVPVAPGAEVAVEAELKVDPGYNAIRPSFRVATLISAGVAVGAGAAAGVLAFFAVKRADQAEAATTMREAFTTAARSKDFALGANISFAVAGAGLVTSIVLAIVFKNDVFGRSSAPAAAAPPASAGVMLLPGGAGATLEVAW